MNKFGKQFAGSLLFLMTPLHAEDLSQAEQHDWLDRNWEIRYLLFVGAEKDRETNYREAQQFNAKVARSGNTSSRLHGGVLLQKATTFSTPNWRAIATTLISFDAQGNVIGGDNDLRDFTGKLSSNDLITLILDGYPATQPYALPYLRWSQGIPGNLSFGPSPCTFLDRARYEEGWKSGSHLGDVGCREWTAQLFDEERPYIDVTTYAKRGNFIGQFVGWARLEDAPKPVIGMHGKTWLCLHECPGDEQPGIIADIKAWTGKHGYPIPRRPKQQPEYPDKDYYLDIACE